MSNFRHLLFLRATLLLAVWALCGCGSTSDLARLDGSGSPLESGGPVLRGTARLTPRVPVPDAPVILVDTDGKELARGVSDSVGNFGLTGATPASEHELRVQMKDGTILRCRLENGEDGYAVVDLLTTFIANWKQRYPERSLEQCSQEILDSLKVPQAPGALAASDDSIHSDFDADVALEKAAAVGGIQSLIDTHLDTLEGDSNFAAAFESDPELLDLDLQILGALHKNLAGPGITVVPAPPQGQLGLGPASLIGPAVGIAMGWFGTKVGLNDVYNIAREGQVLVASIQRDIDQTNLLIKQIADVVARGFFDRMVSRLQSPQAMVSTEQQVWTNVQAQPRSRARDYYEAFQGALTNTENSVRNLTVALETVNSTIRGNSSQSGGGLLQAYRTQARMGDLLRQDQLDGMAFLVISQRGFTTSALSLLLDRERLGYSANLVNESALSFEREMLQLKLRDNDVIKELEFTGGHGKEVTGRDHADRKWAERAIPLDLLQNLKAFGLQSAGFDTSLAADAAVGTSAFTVRSETGIRVGNLVTLDDGGSQEKLTVQAVDGTRITTTEGSRKAHPAGAAFRGANGSVISSGNLLYDKDADLVWLLPAANYWTRTNLGLKESGFNDWLTPTPAQLSHLFSHASERSLQSLTELGFWGLDTRSIHLAASSARYNFNILDAMYRVDLGTAFPLPFDTSKNELAFHPYNISLYLTQQILVREPVHALSRLEISHGPHAGAYRTGALKVYPDTSVNLRATAVTSDRGLTFESVDLTPHVVWTIVSGPRIYDPLGNSQIDYDRARLRVSNAPGSEGRLEVVAFPGEGQYTPNETYEVQAQLGSNTARLTLTVTPFPLSATESRNRRPPSYVSHIISQSAFTNKSGDLPVRFRSLGRFSATEVPTAKLASTDYDASQPAPDHSVDITANSIWSVEPTNNAVSIAPQVSAGQEAELVVNRANVPVSGLEVTIANRYNGADGKTGTARTRVLVTR